MNQRKNNQKGEVTILALSIIAMLVMGTMSLEAITEESETPPVVDQMNES